MLRAIERGAVTKRWVRFAVTLFSLVVALGAFLPLYAKAFAGPQTHVCHCETGSEHGHAHCACPICFPELADDLSVLSESVKGRCGDDDLGWRTFAQPAVLPPVVGVLLPSADEIQPSVIAPLHPKREEPPDPRPPRSFVS